MKVPDFFTSGPVQWQKVMSGVGVVLVNGRVVGVATRRRFGTWKVRVSYDGREYVYKGDDALRKADMALRHMVWHSDEVTSAMRAMALSSSEAWQREREGL